MTQKKSLINFVAIIAIVSMLFISGCIQPPINAQAKELPKFSSCTALQSAFEETQNGNGRYYPMLYDTMGVAQESSKDSSNGSAPTSGATPSYSNTNVQVQGVDEADIVKTDGKYIYTISNNRLNIVEAFPASEAKLISSTDLKKVSPQEMLVQGNTLLVFGSSYEQIKIPIEDLPQPIEGIEGEPIPVESGGGIGSTGAGSSGNAGTTEVVDETIIADSRMIAPGYWPQYYSKNLAVALLFDISDKENPKLERSLEFEGSYLSSRMIGDKVYFTINSYPNYNWWNTEKMTSQDLIPTYRERNSGEIIEQFDKPASTQLAPIAPCEQIAYFPPMQAQSFVTLASLSMSNLGSNVEKQTIVGSGQNVYASNNNLYIAEVQYNYGPVAMGGIGIAIKNAVETIVEPAIIDEPASEPTQIANPDEPVANTTDEPATDDTQPLEEPQPIVAPEPAQPIQIEEDTQKTIIHKFSLNNGKIEYLGNMEAKGTILNQFSMDEFNEHFRIATTIQKWSTWNNDTGSRNLSTNNVYVFDSDFKQVGKLEDLAPGETIYSARFMGERAYLVTFERIDPFFVIDLSNPSDPRVLGKLKIPGYSNYLHPIDATHVLGVGKEAVEASFEPGFAWYLGMKMAIFDVTDPTNPIELHKITIGDRGTDSAALYDHKAFLYDAEKHLLVLPIALYEIDETVKDQYDYLPDNWPSYGVFKFQGAFVYNVTLEDGFKEIGRITHNTNEDILKMGYWYYGYGKEVRRSLYIDNVLYTVSDSMIKANDLTDLKEITSIDLPQPEQQYYPYYYGGIETTIDSVPMTK
ncbi:MAG: beta-propeller domain-containing protein [archaeon]|nr:beta-propeller domain-containing protein [archaeon]